MSAFQRRQIQAAMDGKLAQLGGPDLKPSFRIGWNEAREETLKRMWREGYSAGDIARHLKGVTRGAVCGKLDRLGLLGSGEVRAEPSAPAARGLAASASLDASGAPKGRPRHAKKRTISPEAPPSLAPSDLDARLRGHDEEKGGQAGEKRTPRPAKRERKPCRIAAVPPGFAASLPEHREPAQTGLASSMAERSGGHAIMDLPLSRCRWPVNDAVRADGHLFCGEKNAPGKMYCPRHAARAVDASYNKRKGGDA